MEISDRDFIKQSRGLSLTNNNSKFQNYLLNTFKNYSPDLVFFGHTNNLEKNTIFKFKEINHNLIISYWNEDPVMPGLDYSKKNIQKKKYTMAISKTTFELENEASDIE